MLGSRYFPCFSTRIYEFMAYSNCTSAVKDAIVPVVTLTRQRNAETFAEAFDLVAEIAEGRPVIVDFDRQLRDVTSAQEADALRRRKAAQRQSQDGKKPRERTEKELARYAEMRRQKEAFNAHLTGLVSDREGAIAWIGMAASKPGFIPTVQLNSPEVVQDQVQVANRSGYPLAFRVAADDLGQVAIAGMALSALNDPSSSFLLVDTGFVRNRVSTAARQTDAALSALKNSAGEAFDQCRKVVVGGSFPASSLRELPRQLEMEERLHHELIAGSWPVEYGDHASLPKKSNRKGGNGWFPHVDLTMSRHWRIELEERNSDSSGYMRCADKTVKSDDWKARTNCWGTSVIEQVSEGTTTVGDTKFVIPGPWIAVRANQHITSHAGRK